MIADYSSEIKIAIF